MRIAVALFVIVAACGPPPRESHDAAPGGAPDAERETACAPGTAWCVGDTSHVCSSDGGQIVEVECSAAQGLECDPVLGVCTGGPCAPDVLGPSYVGCDYYPTVTANLVDADFTFAVAVSNTQPTPATITITGGALTQPIVQTIDGDGVAVVPLPWVGPLKQCMTGGAPCDTVWNESVLAEAGAYRVQSNVPVTVWQFNPLQYQLGDRYSYTNDASLLLPRNAWRTTYLAASWPAWHSPLGLQPSLVAVTASRPTVVTLTTTTTTVPGPGVVVALSPGVPQDLTLAAGDVLQLVSTAGDLTGTRIVADQPIQVIGGHVCTNVPFETPACDHLEETLIPIDGLGARYAVTAPAVPELVGGRSYVTRIIAEAAGTTLTFDPPQGPTVPTFIADAGGVVEVGGFADFVVAADHKIEVVQYMTGQGFIADRTGDPAMAVVVPVGQYRTDYLFHAPLSYEVSYVNVVAPLEADIDLDGQPLPALTRIGTSELGRARVRLDDGADGNHRIDADMPFGISVYGYGKWTSYWYPGGLNLDPIVEHGGPR